MSAIDPWLEWEFVDGVVGYYSNAMGEVGFMFVFFGATFVGLWQASGSVMLSVVALILLAPLVMALMPAIGVQFVAVVVLLMMAAGGFWLYQRAGV